MGFPCPWCLLWGNQAQTLSAWSTSAWCGSVPCCPPSVSPAVRPVLGVRASCSLQIKRLIRKYIQRQETISLVVVPSNVDIATTEALSMAQEVDPEGDRTIGEQGARVGPRPASRGRGWPREGTWLRNRTGAG